MQPQAKELLLSGAFIPAMPLVLNANRQFDEQGQRRLVRYYLSAGVDGIAAAVHTTQFAIRDPKIALLEPVLTVVKEEIDAYTAKSGRTVLAIAGACGPVQQAVAEAQLAKSLGYDAVLLSPGGLGSLSEEDLIARTRQVAEVLDVVGFYLQPAVGGRVFTYDYWQKICAIPEVVAIKCAAFSRYLTVDVARAIAFADHKIALYTGNDDNILCDLLTTYRFGDGHGGTVSVRTCGGLLGHWAAWTHTAVTLFKQIKALSPDEPLDPKWLTLAAQITDVNSAFFDTAHNFAGCIAGIHEVLHRQGLMDNIFCLDENETLSPGQAEEISRVHSMYPHLHDDAFVAEFLKTETH